MGPMTDNPNAPNIKALNKESKEFEGS